MVTGRCDGSAIAATGSNTPFNKICAAVGEKICDNFVECFLNSWFRAS